MTIPEKRRRRPAVSCTLCRRRKIRCNREQPCSNCLRSRTGTACVYDNGPQQSLQSASTLSGCHAKGHRAVDLGVALRPRSVPETDDAPGGTASNLTTPSSHQPASLPGAASTTPTTPSSSHGSAQDAESLRLKNRIRQLEEQLAKSTLQQPQAPPQRFEPRPVGSNVETMSSQLSGTFHINCEPDPAQASSQGIARSVAFKTRFLGQSHWSVTAILLIRDLFEAMERPSLNDLSQAMEAIERCKHLARIIKTSRAPKWPSLPTPDLPPREVADALVDGYLRTTESVYRILHIPSFLRDYNTLWESSSSPDTAFLVQAKLVLAIGAVLYDEKFTLRTSAIRWVYEAQTWLSEPRFKSRLDIATLQTNILLLLAQELVGVGGDVMWISLGALLRKAMHMGLHRDPAHLPARSVLDAEIRRRLWNTLMELSLQSSLASGGPCLLSVNDFDTATPHNFNDEQLTEDDPEPVPAHEFTHTTIAMALRKSFPQRLAVVRLLNDCKSGDAYQETIRLDRELRDVYKELRETLQACRGAAQVSTSQPDIRLVELLVQRYFVCLHVPYFGPAMREASYAYSRKVVIDASLKIWRASFPIGTDQVNDTSSPATQHQDDLARLAVCGSGSPPTSAMHAALLIAMELRAQIQEDDGLMPAPLRPDMVAVVEESKDWSLRGVEAGETNVKGHLLMSAVTAQLQGMMRGLAKDEIAERMVEAVADVGARCVPVLEEMAASLGHGTQDRQLNLADVAMDPVEDWDFMTTNELFDVGSLESMNWLFSTDGNAEMLGL